MRRGIPPVARESSRNQVILRRNYLPASIRALPGVSELISSVESASTAAAAQVKDSCDYMHIAEIVHPHAFVARPLDAIRPVHALDHLSPVHHRRVFGIDEPGCEQSLERRCITASQRCRPLILELDRREVRAWNS